MRLLTLAAAAAILVTSALGAGTARAEAMATGGRTSQPLGHWELCQSHPRDCTERTRRTDPVRANPDVIAVLRAVNDRVNGAVIGVTDWQQHGVEERWSYPARYGDCEDYVLAKRRMLMEYGFKAGDLLITVVTRPEGDGHAVLSVRTDRGEFVLDNIDRRVRHWTDTRYTYVKRQSERHAGTWVSIHDGRRVAMR